METYTNLKDLTDQEFGIIIQGKTVIVCNWESVGLNNGSLPVLISAGFDLLYPWPSEEKIYNFVNKYEVYNVLECLPKDYDLLYDNYGDIERMTTETTSGKVYELVVDGENILVVAPEGWN